MDKMMTLGIMLTAKDMFSPIFGKVNTQLKTVSSTMQGVSSRTENVGGSFKWTTQKLQGMGSALAPITSGFHGVRTILLDTGRASEETTKKLGTLTKTITTIGAVSQGAFLVSKGAVATVIESYSDLESAQIELKSVLMKSNGSVSPFFDTISKQAIQLGIQLPGTAKDFYEMATKLKSLGITEQSIVGGALEASAKMAVVLKVPYEQAAESVAIFKQSLSIADKDVNPFIDNIQRMVNMGADLTQLQYAFSKVGGTLKGLGLEGIITAQKIEPLVGLLVKNGMTGEAVGTSLGAIINDSIKFASSSNKNKVKEKFGIDLEFTNAKGKFLGIDNMVKQFEKLKSLSDENRQKVAGAMGMGSGEEMVALNNIVKAGTKGLGEFTKAMNDQASLEKRAALQTTSLANKWESMKGTAEMLGSSLGSSLSPQLKSITDHANDLFSSMNDLTKKFPTATKWVVGLTFGAIGLAGVLGALGIAVGALSYGIGALGIKTGITTISTWLWNTSLVASSTSVLGMIGRVIVMSGILTAIGAKMAIAAANTWLLNTAFSANPVGILIVGFTALIGIGALLYNSWKPFRDVINDINKGFNSAIDWVATIGIDTPAKPKFAPASNPRVSSARQAVMGGGGRYGGQSITHNTTNTFIVNGTNSDPKAHAIEIQKHLDKLTRDKNDKSYGNGSQR